MDNQPHDSQASDFPEFGGPAIEALALAGYTRLEHLTKVTEKELLAIHGVGPKAVRILGAALAEKGMAFAGSDFPKLAAPAQRALIGAGITQLEYLTKMSEDEVKNLHGMAPNALDTLRSALEAKGLSFAKKV